MLSVGLLNGDFTTRANEVETVCRSVNAGVCSCAGANSQSATFTCNFPTAVGNVVSLGLDVILFRELNAKRDFSLDLGPFGSASSAEVLSPCGHAAVKDGVLSVAVPDALDFVWARIR
ncbi:MAG: hypothetical protein IJI73_08655 [Kiritimatiellae bacterium]|nr:hypothetical protein [Kiritimatiellia bacterium]